MTTAWTLCTDAMPDDGLVVLAFCPDAPEPVWPAHFDEGRWIDLKGFDMLGVTHWAHFPEGPKP